MERGRRIASSPGAVAREGLRYVITIRAVGAEQSLRFYVSRGPRCTCPDFNRNGGGGYRCEHIYAVAFFTSDKQPGAAALTALSRKGIK